MGKQAMFPTGIFFSKEKAESLISKYSLTGVLSVYPIDIILYDWAIENNFFEAKKDYQKSPIFIEQFSCASIEHYHYEKGELC
ncbi:MULTISPECIES: hypothetical protein [unclassified Arcicella]|uniref:DUF7710 domain-containing protein n=1 Tax=unclassified Arcicella TaxID=2644986 RepID=UPI002863E502|nr:MULTISPECIES: hypothetical protein [unclassified Arcicella]MDR6561564.1 hypothetical protein [Arcicella sp. BE51]